MRINNNQAGCSQGSKAVLVVPKNSCKQTDFSGDLTLTYIFRNKLLVCLSRLNLNKSKQPQQVRVDV